MRRIDMRTSSVIFLTCLIILVLVTSINGSSDDWVEYQKSKNGDVFLYDKVSVQHTTQYIVQVWGKCVFSDKGREEYIRDRKNKGVSTEWSERVTQVLYLYGIDCKKRRSQIISITEYDMDGNILSSNSYDKPGWSSIPPDSRVDNLREEVCK